MASSTYTAKSTLSYPLYCAAFDPKNDRYLLVGGGGGEGRSGIGNSISLLDTSSKSEIAELTDIELSRDEDSVTSLAVFDRAPGALSAFAGINSSTDDQEAGKNDHLRAFEINLPPQGKSGEQSDESKANIQASGSTSLFMPSTAEKKETYQRVLRLFQTENIEADGEGVQCIGVVATGLAKEGEVVVFNASKGLPKASDICGRISLAKGEEAADIDITEEEEFRVAYCTDYEVYLYTIPYHLRVQTTKSPSPRPGSLANPRLLYSTPYPDVFETNNNARPTFRALRFLTPNLLLLLHNRPHRSGAELIILRIVKGLGDIILRKRLHKSMKAAISLDVAVLDADSSGLRQIVVAVAGQDVSIELLTLDYAFTKGLSKFRHYSTLRDVHPLQVTKIAFSKVYPPKEAASNAIAQYLKLASTSMGNTVIVHTFPLTRIPLGHRSKTPRYVLVAPSEALQTGFSLFLSLFMVIFGAMFLQALLEVRGGTPPYLGVVDRFPALKDWVAVPYVLEDSSIVKSTKQGLRYLLSQRGNNGDGIKAIIVRDSATEVSADVYNDEEVVRSEAKRWEELKHHERESWKKRLVDAGEWAVEEGESVFKGVFFAQIAGAVGQAARG
ncbi:MAG: hypothetical protein M1827_000621 [Pycnora praestabilis]|nr:MAG: hypothetical protein M1827_000621 [Pycnora praestabilis]